MVEIVLESSKFLAGFLLITKPEVGVFEVAAKAASLNL